MDFILPFALPQSMIRLTSAELIFHKRLNVSPFQSLFLYRPLLDKTPFTNFCIDWMCIMQQGTMAHTLPAWTDSCIGFSFVLLESLSDITLQWAEPLHWAFIDICNIVRDQSWHILTVSKPAVALHWSNARFKCFNSSDGELMSSWIAHFGHCTGTMDRESDSK